MDGVDGFCAMRWIIGGEEEKGRRWRGGEMVGVMVGKRERG